MVDLYPQVYLLKITKISCKMRQFSCCFIQTNYLCKISDAQYCFSAILSKYHLTLKKYLENFNNQF